MKAVFVFVNVVASDMDQIAKFKRHSEGERGDERSKNIRVKILDR